MPGYDGEMTGDPPQDPRMRGFRSRSSVAAVERIIDDRVAMLGSEFVPLRDAHGRVLADRVGGLG